jgi:hypothetical protein
MESVGVIAIHKYLIMIRYQCATVSESIHKEHINTRSWHFDKSLNAIIKDNKLAK